MAIYNNFIKCDHNDCDKETFFASLIDRPNPPFQSMGGKDYCREHYDELMIDRYGSTKCRTCGKDHGLQDIDAGSEREIKRQCNSCFKKNK